MREQENSAMVKYLEELQKQDWEEARKKKEQQKKLAVSLFLLKPGNTLLYFNFLNLKRK